MNNSISAAGAHASYEDGNVLRIAAWHDAFVGSFGVLGIEKVFLITVLRYLIPGLHCGRMSPTHSSLT